MPKVTVFYSAAEQDVLAVVGDKIEVGAQAVTFGGTKATGSFDSKEKAVEGIQYLKQDLETMGEVVFLLYGGNISPEGLELINAADYEQIGEIEIE